MLVGPDGIEPTTSSMPLSWPCISDDFHCGLEFTKSLAHRRFSRNIVFRSFPIVNSRWRFGGDLSWSPKDGEANQATSREPQAAS
jgi:hypothetical protein